MTRPMILGDYWLIEGVVLAVRRVFSYAGSWEPRKISRARTLVVGEIRILGCSPYKKKDRREETIRMRYLPVCRVF